LWNARIVALINHDFEASVQDLFSPPFSRDLWFGILAMFCVSLLVVGIIGWTEKIPQSDTLFHFISIVFQNGKAVKYVALKLFPCSFEFWLKEY